MKKHAFDELVEDPAKRKKFYQEEIAKLKLEKNLALKEQRDAEKNAKLVGNSVTLLKERLEENNVLKINRQEQMQQAQTEFRTANDQKKKVAEQVKASMFQLDEVKHAAEALKTKLSGFETQLDKIEPIYSTLRRLRAHARQKESNCFKGLLIDFIECTNPQFNAVVDIAGKQKLFCAIVDDLSSA